MNHKTITKFVLGISMVASLGFSGTHSHAADMSKYRQADNQVYTP